MLKEPVFGSNDSVFNQRALGTAPISYRPVVDSEVVVKFNKEILINVRLLCITVMKWYKHKSLEELRLEDLKAGHYTRPKTAASSGPWESLPGWFLQPAKSKSTLSFSLPVEPKPAFGFGQPVEVKPSAFFNQPAKTNLSFGFGKPAESKPSFGSGHIADVKPLPENLSHPVEAKPFAFVNQPTKTNLSFGFGKPAESKPSFGFGLPAELKPQTGNLSQPVKNKLSFGLFNQTAKTNLSFGFGQPTEDKSLGQSAEPKPAGSSDQPVEANPFFGCLTQPTEVKQQILGSNARQGNCSEQMTSLVYKCYACGLCFDRHEFMSKHFTNCVPFKKMTRIHCICGLQFDRNNYDYHCEVHRKSTELVQKIVTINDDDVIGVGGMKEDFVEDYEKVDSDEALKENPIGHINKEKVSAVHDFNINFIPVHDEHPTKSTDILAAKVSTVYRCTCRLCFERPDFLFNHINNCGRVKKTTRILCVCGLEFDKHNYDYHCEIHRKYNLLHVKKITIRSDEAIPLAEMREEFAEDKMKAGEPTKDAQMQTDLNEPLVKNSAAEHAFNGNATKEKISGRKIISAVIDTIESGIDGEDNYTKITIVIPKESEKNIERSNKADPKDFKINEVAEIRKSVTNDSEMAIDDINGATEEDHKANDNQVTPDIAPDENVVPTKPEDKSISGSNSADREANDSEMAIDDIASNMTGATEEDHKPNDDQVTPNIEPDENTTPIKAENKAISSSDSADGEANEITEQIKQFNINDDQENSDKTDNV